MNVLLILYLEPCVENLIEKELFWTTLLLKLFELKKKRKKERKSQKDRFIDRFNNSPSTVININSSERKKNNYKVDKTGMRNKIL